ncbi:MAG: MBL fold metallo-hydrolase [Deltaproteobacteria bacterium]|nr:MBL fold metallo-hydrolase [Deltaproteobacteria bacterium]
MLKKLVVGFIQANCYIIGCPKTQEGVVVDPGDETARIVDEITRSTLTIRYILLTHGHFDHVGSAEELRDITKLPVLIHDLDSRFLGFKPDGFLYDGLQIQIGTYTLSVLHTPGHTPGGVSIHAPGVVFTGDTLFAGSIGRTDLPGGDYHRLIESVKKKIFPLGDDVRIYPGHGPASTIGQERRTNPFFS